MINSVCNSEQFALRALGYTQASWDNLSGKEQQPWSTIKFWASLTANEKAAAVLLGYTQTNWDNDSRSEPQPASAAKSWSELTACADGEDLSILLFSYRLLLLMLPAGHIYIVVFLCM